MGWPVADEHGDPAWTHSSCANARRRRSPRGVRSSAIQRITSALRSGGTARPACSARLSYSGRRSGSARYSHAASTDGSLPGGTPTFSPSILLALLSPTYRSMRRCSYSSWLAIMAAPAAKSDGEGRKRASQDSIVSSTTLASGHSSNDTTVASLPPPSSTSTSSALRGAASMMCAIASLDCAAVWTFLRTDLSARALAPKRFAARQKENCSPAKKCFGSNLRIRIQVCRLKSNKKSSSPREGPGTNFFRAGTIPRLKQTRKPRSQCRLGAWACHRASLESPVQDGSRRTQITAQASTRTTTTTTATIVGLQIALPTKPRGSSSGRQSHPRASMRASVSSFGHIQKTRLCL